MKFNRKKSGTISYANRLFKSFFLIGIICTTLYGTISTGYFIKSSYDTSHAVYRANLDKLQSEITLTMDKVDLLLLQLSSNPMVESYFHENNRDNLDYFDINEISELIVLSHATLSDPLESIYLVYPELNIVITSYGIFNWDGFVDKEWLDTSNIDDNIRLVNRAGTLGEARNSCVSTVMQYPLLSAGSPKGYIVANISQKYLNNLCERYLTDDAGILLFNSEGGFIAGSGNKFFSDIAYEDLLYTTGGPKLDLQLINDGLFIHVLQNSETLDWSFNYYAGMENLISTLLVNFLTALTITVTLYVVFALIAKKLSDNAYSPIELLLHNISNEGNSIKTLPKYAEFKKIHKFIERSENELQDLREKIIKELPNLREKFFLDIMLGRVISFSSLEERLHAIGLDKNEKLNYTVATIKLLEINTDDFELNQSQAELSFIVTLALRDYLNNSLAVADIDFYNVCIQENDLHVIIGRQDKDKIVLQENIKELFESLLIFSAEALSTKIIIGIGSIVNDILLLQNTYNDSKEAIERELPYGSSRIFNYDDAPNSVNLSYINPLYYEKSLIYSVKNGNISEINAIIKNVNHNIKSCKYSLTMTRSVYICIINIISLSMQDNSQDSNFAGKLRDYTKRIYEALSIDKIEAIVYDLCREAVEYSRQTRKQNSEILANKIEEYLRQNYHNDISLEDLSAEFSYTSVHINKTLRINFGITFYDMLTSIRIQNAKNLLAKTDKNIHTISEEVGYANVQSFIRMFKKAENITPGQYRKEHLQ